MDTVNELLQNIRFLKYYGWGKSYDSIFLVQASKCFTEYYWGAKTSERRESELGWRVKENVVDTAISFIW